MTDTVTRLMGLIEAYRTAGGREEHWARKDALEAELARQEAVMRLALEAFREVAGWESEGDPRHPASEAIKALEDALK